MKVVIGLITFNCLKYTKLCINSIKCSYPHEILTIDNGSTDGTVEWLRTQNITLIENGRNLGVPYCSNNMFDYTWKDDPSNLLVVLSNDMVCLPNAIDDLIQATTVSKANVISGGNMPSPVYLCQHPEDRQFFFGGNNISIEPRSFGSWKPGTHYNLIESTADEFVSIMYSKMVPTMPPFRYDFWGYFIPGHRVYKKAYLDAVGYFDANFYPIYHVDFDYAIRAKILSQPCDIVPSSFVFEFWSRVLYEGKVPIRDVRRDDYFHEKWGSGADNEKYDWTVPFDGKFPDKYKGYDTSNVVISSRVGELERVNQLSEK